MYPKIYKMNMLVKNKIEPVKMVMLDDYNVQKDKIETATEITEKIIEEYKMVYGDKPSKLLFSLKTQLKILKGDDK